MEPDWSALRNSIRGEVVLPADPGYEAVRRPAVARFHHLRPQALVQCAADADVAVALSFARAVGLPFAVRGGGHSFEGASSTEGIVLDLSRISGVSFLDGGGNGAGPLVRVGAGARLGDIYDALAPSGVTIPAGCGPTVGVAGLTLGGGLGVLGRAHGLTCDALRAARVVLADGRIVDCDEELEPELFWALRGGGNGTIGVVTSLVFASVPAPAMTSFHFTWEPEHLPAVLAAWQSWAPAAPDTMAASLVVSTAADPALLPVTSVFGAAHGTEEADVALLEEFVDRVGEPAATQTHQRASHRETKRLLADLDVHGVPRRADAHGHSRSEFFAQPLDGDMVAGLVALLSTDRRPGEERELDFTPWAGAYNRVPRDATAFPHRTARFLLKHGVAVDAEASADDRIAARDWLDRAWQLTHPAGTGGVYPNFPDPELDNPARAYFGENADRLRDAVRAYDPDGVFGFRAGALA
ncbi:FAD-binding oxidoreductase [Asanoa sp. WMMD1127]|uniref:FAD-binding oxidoreductase n=1 Tax=Asanoa sp. WMMD1127 TaxID=3016107 RepID=UPI0024160A6B|nr:FAD-binding oxidoreductase [Asanoa sp. WMMD1127]MDG4821442.1 FAD-binding oxidoreductase [Asanoa sp. WMMD1127]